jgi:K+/H+ antiporter YhaU regulatory subunit KhtT
MISNGREYTVGNAVYQSESESKDRTIVLKYTFSGERAGKIDIIIDFHDQMEIKMDA